MTSIRQHLHAFSEGFVEPSDLAIQALRAIDRHDPLVNAVPTRIDSDRVLEQARRIGEAMRRGDPVGVLAGMPYVAKDTHRTKGVRTTYGSPIFADHVPDQDDPIVERLSTAGCVLLGKSNTPEFAAGSQTINPVFGTTRNPYALDRTVGGSSGGGACALATGMAIVADGSDLAASLRNPASFCGVVGLRPTSHARPDLAMAADRFGTLSVVGTMGRCVDDVRLGRRAVFAPPAHRPLNDWARWLADETRERGRGCAAPNATDHAVAPGPLPRDPRGLRIAWTIDADGQMPVSAPVHQAMRRVIHLLREAGVELVEAHPDMAGADDCFQVLRGEYFVENFGPYLDSDPDKLKEAVRWNIEFGLDLDVERIAAAKRMRARIFDRMRHFLGGLDAWLLPTAQVLPFSHRESHPTEIGGIPMTTYIDWLKSCYWITLAGHPAISLPAGLAADEADPPGARLPVGLQLVGHWGEDEALLDVAETLETLLTPLNGAPPTPVA